MYFITLINECFIILLQKTAKYTPLLQMHNFPCWCNFRVHKLLWLQFWYQCTLQLLPKPSNNLLQTNNWKLFFKNLISLYYISIIKYLANYRSCKWDSTFLQITQSKSLNAFKLKCKNIFFQWIKVTMHSKPYQYLRW